MEVFVKRSTGRGMEQMMVLVDVDLDLCEGRDVGADESLEP